MPAKQVMTHQGVLQIAIVAHQAVAVIPSRHWRPVLRTSLYRGSSPGGFVVTMLNSAGHYHTERVPRDQFSLVICSCQTAPNSYLSSPNSTLLVAICLWYQNDEIRLQTHPAHWSHLPINKIINIIIDISQNRRKNARKTQRKQPLPNDVKCLLKYGKFNNSILESHSWVK